jgi:hypothetical protein
VPPKKENGNRVRPVPIVAIGCARTPSEKNCEKTVPGPPLPCIYQSGRDILFDVRFQERRTRRDVVPAKFRTYSPMVVIALLTVGLLGDGFMLYALIHWMRDDVRHRNQ